MSNNTNGAVNRGTVINTGVALISIIGILYVAYVANGLDEKFNILQKIVNDFIDMWENRIKISNVNNNNTQLRLLNIANNQTQVESELLNASKHRTMITQEVLELQNLTNTLIKQFNATNEQERGKAVDNIIGNMTEKFDTLFKGLNITESDNETDAESDIAKLKEALEALENKTNTS